MTDVFEFAMQMEKDGEAYYRELADKAGHPGLQRILTMLADEEVKHYNTFKRLKEGKPGDFSDSTIFQDAKNVFEEIRESGQKVFDFEAEAKEHYEKAKELEKKSEDLYREKANETDDAETKKLLNLIADEERRHYILFDNMQELVLRPERWLENAEWRHMDEY
ncbi:rubrerythrin [bacterium]|nr:rubrerythrin [bacterium]